MKCRDSVNRAVLRVLAGMRRYCRWRAGGGYSCLECHMHRCRIIDRESSGGRSIDRAGPGKGRDHGGRNTRSVLDGAEVGDTTLGSHQWRHLTGTGARVAGNSRQGLGAACCRREVTGSCYMYWPLL